MVELTPEQEEHLAKVHRSCDDAKRQMFEANEEIKALLTESEEKTALIKIGTMEIKILAAPPKALRRELIKYSRICSKMDSLTEEDVDEKDKIEGELDNVESHLYPLLTQMVVAPAILKDPAAWEYLDEKQGIAVIAYQMILEKINERSDDIKNSRRRTRGKSS